jgi:hypothetical protein
MSEASKDYGPQEKITKLDAARRQLHTAIRLFLENGDPISVHTLSRASHEILRTLLIAKGGGSFLKDSEYIKPEHRELLSKYLNHPSNFFKHADRDPDDVLTFYHMLCPIWLMDCCMMYQKLTGKFSRECAVFVMWFTVQYPDLLAPESAQLVRGLLDSGMVSKTVITKEFCSEIIQKPSSFPVPKIGLYEDDRPN